MTAPHRIDAVTALLGMPGFVVAAHAEHDGEHMLFVRTTTEEVGCPACGTRAVRNGRRRVLVRDLPVADKPLVLAWSKQLWRCPDTDCPAGAWTESSPHVGPRRCLTERARWEICRRVGEDEDTVAQVAAAFGVAWDTAWTCVVELGEVLVANPGRVPAPHALGFDDVNFSRPRPDHRARWATVAVDLVTGKLLDIFEGRDTAEVRAWLDARGMWWCMAVRVLASDHHQAYRSAAKLAGPDGSSPRMPEVTTVADPFHVVGIANDHLLRCRLRVQTETLGRRGQRGDPLFAIQRRLMVGFEHLSERAKLAVTAGLEAGDPQGEVAELWSIKEQVRAILAMSDLRIAGMAFDALVARCRASAVPEARSMVRPLRSWRNEILASTATGFSNARSEAVNLHIEELVRRARGFRNFENYRLRMLLVLGGVEWDTHRTVRLRGRRPRLIA